MKIIEIDLPSPLLIAGVFRVSVSRGAKFLRLTEYYSVWTLVPSKESPVEERFLEWRPSGWGIEESASDYFKIKYIDTRTGVFGAISPYQKTIHRQAGVWHLVEIDYSTPLNKETT